MTTERMPDEVQVIMGSEPAGVPAGTEFQPRPVSVQTCFKKLIKAGFRVYRRQDNIIKECRSVKHTLTQFEWYHLEKYPSKAAAQRAMDQILQDDFAIEL